MALEFEEEEVSDDPVLLEEERIFAVVGFEYLLDLVSSRESGFSVITIEDLKDYNGDFRPKKLDVHDLELRESPRVVIDADYHGWSVVGPDGYPTGLHSRQALVDHIHRN